MSKIVIFIFSVIYTGIAVIIGGQLEKILPEVLIKIVGCLILTCIGINMILFGALGFTTSYLSKFLFSENKLTNI